MGLSSVRPPHRAERRLAALFQFARNSHGADIHVLRPASSSIKTGVTSGWIGATSGPASVVRKLKTACTPPSGATLIPWLPLPFPPCAGENHQWPAFVTCKPRPKGLRPLVVVGLCKAGDRHQAATERFLEIGLPISAVSVAHVGMVAVARLRPE